MDLSHFLATVEHEAGLPRPAAEQATRATLQALAQRLSGGEARDIARQLPPEVRPWLDDGAKAEPFGVDEFVRRVAQAEGVDEQTALDHARAVFAALGRAVSFDELHDLASELPKEFDRLLLAAVEPPPDPVIAGDADDAAAAADARIPPPPLPRRAVDAVLETLAERIARGEVEDLMARLPPEFHEPLRRGDELSHGAARKMDLKAFLRHVAEREGVTPEDAREHARAVFLWLRDVVGEDEIADVVAQLPDEYAVVTARR